MDSNPTSTRGNRVLRFAAGLIAAFAFIAAIALSWPSGGEPTEQAPPSATVEDTSRAAPANSVADTASADTATSHAAEPVDGSEEPSPPPASTPAPAERDCSPRIPEDFRLTETAPGPASVEVSQAAFECAHEVGLAFATNPPAITTMAASGIRGPLLLVGGWFDDGLIAELHRLAPERIVAAGFDEGIIRDALAGFTVEPMAVDWEAAFPSYPTVPDRVWLVDPAKTPASLMALGIQIGVGVVAVEGDVRALPAYAREMIAGATRVDLLSDFEEDAAWQLEVVRRNDEIPGGGLIMFGEGDGRRLVAVYGHPVTSALGVLGEQGPEEGVDRLRSIMEGYGADGLIVVPAFEIIATVASAGAGGDGDYSSETARDVIRPWIEIAAANDVYVVLDLQPGRTDFLTQAKIYEEFLRLPHVGLALDPEWRLKPDQVHLRQIGTVDAAEINRVVEWLAAIVRDEALPQKLFIVHQFRFSMITNRSLIETPPSWQC